MSSIFSFDRTAPPTAMAARQQRGIRTSSQTTLLVTFVRVSRLVTRQYASVYQPVSSVVGGGAARDLTGTVHRARVTADVFLPQHFFAALGSCWRSTRGCSLLPRRLRGQARTATTAKWTAPTGPRRASALDPMPTTCSPRARCLAVCANKRAATTHLQGARSGGAKGGARVSQRQRSRRAAHLALFVLCAALTVMKIAPRGPLMANATSTRIS